MFINGVWVSVGRLSELGIGFMVATAVLAAVVARLAAVAVVAPLAAVVAPLVASMMAVDEVLMRMRKARAMGFWVVVGAGPGL